MEDNKLIKQEAEELLKKLDIETEVEVEPHDDGYKVLIDTEENALLIGKHGNTLSSLEHILSLLVAKKAGEFKRFILEIGNYRKEREEYLKNLAARLKEEVVTTGLEKRVSGLKAWERRLIHLTLAEDIEVSTESVGEERDRVLVIKKK